MHYKNALCARMQKGFNRRIVLSVYNIRLAWGAMPASYRHTCRLMPMLETVIMTSYKHTMNASKTANNAWNFKKLNYCCYVKGFFIFLLKSKERGAFIKPKVIIINLEDYKEPYTEF